MEKKQYKRGDHVIVVLDAELAKKSPALEAGVEYPCTVTCRMSATRIPSYRVKHGPLLEFQVPESAVVRGFM